MMLEGKGREILELASDKLMGQSIVEIFGDAPEILANLYRALAGEEVAWLGKFRNYLYENRAIPLRGGGGELMGVVEMVTDITHKTQAEEQLRVLAAAVEHAEDSILITSTNLTAPGPEIVFVNQAFTRMTGYAPEEVLGRSPRILQGPKTDRAVLERLLQNLRDGEIFYGEAINYRKDGSEFYNEWHIEPIRSSTGQITHYLAIQRDITQRKQAEAQLRYEALHDNLTRLPNRAFFIKRLRRCIDRAQHCQDYLFAVLFLDLDRFKVINDSLGHQAGDRVLKAVANRLKATVGSSDTVARVGGDEFAILLENLTDIGDVSNLSQQLHDALGEPLQLAQQEVLTTASIGIAVSMLWYDYPEDILRDADIAMYRAKALGKARSVVFNKVMHRNAVHRLQLETDLRKALPHKELHLYYQPIVSLATGEIRGFEALVRWQHPRRGMVTPSDFIPVAEETGLILPIGEWVLREACLQLKRWQDTFANQQPLTMNVNLSGRQFRQPDLSEKVEQILLETEVKRQYLKLEITESAVMEDAESAIHASELGLLSSTQGKGLIGMLEELRSLGIQLSIDDFGTGYSSLSRLYRFPINTLKIDRSFICHMSGDCEGAECDPCSEKIVRAIVTLAHTLGLDVTAEGIETPEQLAQLRELGCEFGQGYLFSKPVDVKQAEALIAAQPRW